MCHPVACRVTSEIKLLAVPWGRGGWIGFPTREPVFPEAQREAPVSLSDDELAVRVAAFGDQATLRAHGPSRRDGSPGAGEGRKSRLI